MEPRSGGSSLSPIPQLPAPQRMAVFVQRGWLLDLALASSSILAVLTRYPDLVVFTTSPDVRWVPAVNYLLTQQ